MGGVHSTTPRVSCPSFSVQIFYSQINKNIKLCTSRAPPAAAGARARGGRHAAAKTSRAKMATPQKYYNIMAGVGNSNCAREDLRYRYRCTLHTRQTRRRHKHTRHTRTHNSKADPRTTEQVLEKETHELRFGNGLGVTARGSGHGMNGVTCRGG